MTATTVRPVAIKIDEDIKARVKRLADARQRTSHWLMREAITQYVDREEKREAFRRDTLKAWEDFPCVCDSGACVGPLQVICVCVCLV